MILFKIWNIWVFSNIIFNTCLIKPTKLAPWTAYENYLNELRWSQLNDWQGVTIRSDWSGAHQLLITIVASAWGMKLDSMDDRWRTQSRRVTWKERNSEVTSVTASWYITMITANIYHVYESHYNCIFLSKTYEI